MKTAGKVQHIIGKPDTQRVQWHLNSSFDQVAMRTDKMAFDHIAQLRRISAEVIRTASLTGQTRKEVSSQLLNKAVTEIPGFQFIDNAGRKWKDKSYFEMLARTELMNAGRASYDDTCARNGFDVVMLTFSGHSCKACTEYEGHLFSLTGATPGLPTKDDLLDAGVFHPNCTHSYTAVSDYERETAFDEKGNPLPKEQAQENAEKLDKQNDDWLEAFDKKHQAEKNGVATDGNGGREDAAAQSAAKAEAEARAKAEEAARAKAEAEARAKEEAAAKAAAEARAKEEAEAKARAEEAAKAAAQAAEAARKAEEQAKQAEEAARKAAEEAARLERERIAREEANKKLTVIDGAPGGKREMNDAIRELDGLAPPEKGKIPAHTVEDEMRAIIEKNIPQYHHDGDMLFARNDGLNELAVGRNELHELQNGPLRDVLFFTLRDAQQEFSSRGVPGFRGILRMPIPDGWQNADIANTANGLLCLNEIKLFALYHDPVKLENFKNVYEHFYRKKLIQCLIWHEVGHQIHHRLIASRENIQWLKDLERLYTQAMANPKLPSYKNFNEWIAENYCAWKMGKKNLLDEIEGLNWDDIFNKKFRL